MSNAMGAAPVLTILKDGQEVKSQPLEGEAMLGRGEGCLIRLDDRAVSRQHALFRPVAGGVQVEKKSDIAPLAVNGSECTTALVKEGDVISIGPYLLKLSTSGAASQTLESAEVSSTQPVPADMTPTPSVPDAPSGSNELDFSPAEPEASPSPFSLEQPGLSSEQSNPVDMGEISIDEEAKTKLVPAGKIAAKLILPPDLANVPEFVIDKDEISIGRGKECDIVLNDKKASRKHAIIRRAGVTFSIKDLGSANGTYVNGVKIEEQELTGDDILKIGNVEFRFLALSEEYAEKQDKFMPVPEDPLPAFDSGFSPPSAAPEAMGNAIPSASPIPGFPGMGAEAAGAAPGIAAGIPGITGIPTGKTSLLAKYRALPPRRKAIWTVVIIAGLFFLLFDNEPQKPHPKKTTPVVAKGGKLVATFESLTPEQKKFVESQHALAFDYYRNRDYDKALFEIDKIFALIPDYKDSREIERYAKEGKRKLEALEEEKRKKEEEEKLKLQVADLVSQAKTAMDQKNFDQAKSLFSQILALDPENQQVGDWRKQLEQADEEQRIAQQQKEVQQQINLRAWDIYKEGVEERKQGKFRDAIASFRKVFDIGSTDKKVEVLARKRISEVEEQIAQLRDPLLAQAKEAEDSQDYSKAYDLYEQSTKIDPPYPAGYAGMNRIRGILHERAKELYIDAVLSESYSDFESAKKKYQECEKVAPKDDVYHDRAERKLASFFNPAGDSSSGGDSQ